MMSGTISTIIESGAIRDIVGGFLERCAIPYPMIPYDLDFFRLSCEEASRRGYPLEGKNSLKPFIPGGVAIATTAYAHVKDLPTRIVICLFTACAIYADDMFHNNAAIVDEFNERFIQNKTQADVILEAFAELIREMAVHFKRVVANIIVTSTLNGVTALLLEYETQGMKLSPAAHNYATFSRCMSGASEAYGLFAFPAQLPAAGYIQALPDLVIYINNVNDLLSFYKEELDGETVNRISLLAACHQISKIEALGRLADEAVEAHQRILRILSSDAEARTAYLMFCQGFVGFHTSFKRYKLDELELQPSELPASSGVSVLMAPAPPLAPLTSASEGVSSSKGNPNGLGQSGPLASKGVADVRADQQSPNRGEDAHKYTSYFLSFPLNALRVSAIVVITYVVIARYSTLEYPFPL
ncbi:isoprenoid synthase domain-containing protein [Collybia nuda]|uniref:Isoprenoid synthase domain-containing protein n=1 Tax=Collybia nuda TaxID=64659 RepID=A0A9P5XT42_9AGAR|nr:isoprenoid synthase domain-containing protein [Collybia nuda]